MPKRFNKKYREIPKLDLHGLKHSEVPLLVENFIMKYQNDLPLEIITGNSDNMKSIVVSTLKEYNFNYSVGDYYNRGYITVLN
tara:strand:+ start:1442 stop:1690 length:249 start_codon:yes stop_codon:yes gene_type:complete